MSILVTGGTGFIGSEVVRTLLKKGEKDVIVFDINPSEKRLDEAAHQVKVVRGATGNFSHGLDIREGVINDYTLQRPQLFYGATKVFCELMGLVYKRKYGLDFRGVRYPSIVGPGVKTPGVVQYTSWVIEECAK